MKPFCADDVAVERRRYYFFFNHLFGLINGFGTEGPGERRRLARTCEIHYSFMRRLTVHLN
ncbi:hypothetical protein ACEQPO_08860 [Bacillus sp. SL00103]